MFRSSLLFIMGMIILIVCDAGSARTRDMSQPANEAIIAASQELSTQVNNFLMLVNQGKAPTDAELQLLAATLQKNRQYVQRMNAKGQADFGLLDAWRNYFEGELKRAKLTANAACKADPQNKDAQATLVAMSIVSNDIKTAKLTVKSMQKKPVKSARAAAQMDDMGMESQRTLEFDPNLIKADLLDEKLGTFDIACLNGASFLFKGGKTLFVFLWSTTANFENFASPDFQSGQTSSPLEAYASLFAKEFQNEKMAFLGLNLDPANDSNKVMITLTKNAWPWPQAMANDPRNAALASLAKLHSNRPSLVIVGADGAIKYAGEFSDLMLRMIAAHPQSGDELAAASETAAEKSADSNSVPAIPEPNAAEIKPAQANTPPAAPAPKPTAAQKPRAQKTEEELLNPAASDLYQFALSQKKMAHITGWGTMVDKCRQILQQYPDSSEAEKARQLLREVPENKRAQYKITNEEMGL